MSLTREQKAILRKMKYISDQSGILNRFLNEENHWKSHLENTRRVILEQVRLKKPGTIAILGSGWWLDLPVDELHNICEQILLVDIHHPPQIKHQAQKYNKITLIESDFTGGIVNQSYQWVQDFKKSRKKILFSDMEFPGFESFIDADYYISLNVIDQIDALVVDYLRKYTIYSSEELVDLGKRIQEAHIQAFERTSGLLVGDYEEIQIDKHGVQAVKPVFHVKSMKGKIVDSWTWEFDSARSYHPGVNTHFNVFAVVF